MKKLIFFLCALLPLCINAQWVITPSGVMVDSITNKPYMIIERAGTATELYREVVRNVHSMFVSPDDAISTIENEMVSVKGYAHTVLKYGGLTCDLEPYISVKIDFKDNRMKVEASWVRVVWMRSAPTDPYTLLVRGSLKCFDKQGKVKNEKRYDIYNEVSNGFINRVMEHKVEEDW